MILHIDVSSGTVLYLLVVYVLARFVGTFLQEAGHDLGMWVAGALRRWADDMEAQRLARQQ